jgi:photosystem II stability/assembly factor-like uncharacterized protein
LFVPLLALSLCALMAFAAAPSVARADTLTWSAPQYGPSDTPNGDSEPIPVASALNAVSFADATHGWAVGVRVDNVSQTAGTRSALCEFTSDGGNSWAQFPIATAAGTSEINGVVARSASDVWAVGDAGKLVHFTGISWAPVAIAGWPSTRALRAIAFSGSNGWAVGDGYGVAVTIDNGDHWTTLVTPGASGTLRAVATVGSGAYAVGDTATGAGSAVMRNLGVGGSWAVSPGTGNALYGISFADAMNGWAVGANATFVHTSNGGATWTAVADNPIPLLPGVPLVSNGLRSVTFANASDGIAVGKYQGVWRTSDGGSSWTVEPIVDTGLGNYELRGVDFVPGTADHPVVVSRAAPLLTQGTQKSRSYRGAWDHADVTPPVTVSDAQAAYVGPATIHLTATDVSGVAHTYYKLDDGSKIEGTTVVVSAAGSHTLEFWSVDASPAQNEETPHRAVTFSVTIPDITAPTTVSDAASSYVGPATIRLTATDNSGGTGVAHTYYVLDGALQTEGVSVSAETAGPHTLEFWSVDVAGNQETPHKTAGFTVTIPDMIAPVTTSDVPATRHYDVNATIHLSATDNVGVAHTYWKLDGGSQSESLPITITFAGTHTLEFWSVDAALNVEPTHTVTFTVAAPAPPADRTPPSTTYSPVDPYTDPTTIHLTATDNVGGSGVASTYWKLDGGVQTSGLTVVVAGPRAHTLEFWSVDVAANIETHHVITVAIPDTTAPVTDSDTSASYLWTASIHLTAADNVAVAHTYWKLDDGSQIEGASVSTSVAGSHTLEFWSVDAAGNPESPHKTAKFVITAPPASLDTTAPVTKWPGAAATFVTKATIVLSASDGNGTGVAGTHYILDSGAETSGTTLSTTKAGAHTVYFWSFDKAGNAEVHEHAHFTVLIATKLSITSNHTSVTHRHSVYFSGTISPNMPNGTHVRFYVLKPGSHSWVGLSIRHTYSSHHWNYTYAPASKGTWYFKATFSATSKYAACTSATRKITVK